MATMHEWVGRNCRGCRLLAMHGCRFYFPLCLLGEHYIMANKGSGLGSDQPELWSPPHHSQSAWTTTNLVLVKLKLLVQPAGLLHLPGTVTGKIKRRNECIGSTWYWQGHGHPNIFVCFFVSRLHLFSSELWKWKHGLWSLLINIKFRTVINVCK